jgi:hypothetical protein
MAQPVCTVGRPHKQCRKPAAFMIAVHTRESVDSEEPWRSGVAFLCPYHANTAPGKWTR